MTFTPLEGYKLVKGEEIKDCVPEGAMVWDLNKFFSSAFCNRRLPDCNWDDFYAIPIQPEKPEVGPSPPEGYILKHRSEMPERLPKTFSFFTGCWYQGVYLQLSDYGPHVQWFAIPNPEDKATHQALHNEAIDKLSSITVEAESIVAGDRAADYGDVNESFARIAGLWSAYKGVEFTPWDVSMMMILLKVSRAKTSRKRDTLVDMIGYAKCASNLKL